MEALPPDKTPVSDDLRELLGRFSREFDAAMETGKTPLEAMAAEERVMVRQAEEVALEHARTIVSEILEDDQEVARQAAAARHSERDIRIMYILERQMLEELQQVRRSEERCLERPDDVELLAAESKYRKALAESHALLDILEGPVFQPCRYLGGYRFLPNPIDRAVLWFDANLQTTYISAGGVLESVAVANAMAVPWTWIDAVAVESPEEIERRVTATRVAAIGWLALAVKKRVKQAILVLETKYEEAIFQIHGYDTVELRAEMSGWQRYFELACWIRNYQPPAKPGPVSRTLARLLPPEGTSALAPAAPLLAERSSRHVRVTAAGVIQRRPFVRAGSR
jgi:hypothetical protein